MSADCFPDPSIERIMRFQSPNPNDLRGLITVVHYIDLIYQAEVIQYFRFEYWYLFNCLSTTRIGKAQVASYLCRCPNQSFAIIGTEATIYKEIITFNNWDVDSRKRETYERDQ